MNTRCLFRLLLICFSDILYIQCTSLFYLHSLNALSFLMVLKMALLISFLGCSLLVFRNVIDFVIHVFVLCSLTELVYQFCQFFSLLCGVFHVCQITCTVLNKVAEAADIFCFLSHLRGSIQYFFIEYVINSGFFISGLYHVGEKLLSILVSRCFYGVRVLDFITCFSTCTEMITRNKGCPLFFCYGVLIDFQMLNQPHIPQINPTWSWCMIFVCGAGFGSQAFC